MDKHPMLLKKIMFKLRRYEKWVDYVSYSSSIILEFFDAIKKRSKLKCTESFHSIELNNYDHSRQQDRF
jgi:hypothetical protein